MAVVTSGVARRPRAYVRVQGPDAEDFLQRMLSNDVSGEVCDALLLTPKARVIAPLRVWRRGDGRLPAADRAGARRDRSRRRCCARASRRSARSSSRSTRRRSSSARPTGSRAADYGVPAVEVLDGPLERDDRRRRARVAADPRRHAALRPRDRRPRPAGRGRARRARGLVHEGLLPRPGADRAAALPRPREPRAARAGRRRAPSCPSTTPSWSTRASRSAA